MINKILTIVLILGLTNTIIAQNKNVSHENQQWLQYSNDTKLNNEWNVSGDVSLRWKDGFKEYSQYLIRTGLGYSIKSNLKVGIGFAYIGSYSQDTLSKVEYRPYQELVFKSAYNKIKFSQRLRVEERFINPLANSNNPFNFRFRYNVSANFPVFKLSKTNPDSMFLLNIADEIFINAGKEIINNVFDQNRVIISPIFQLNKSLSISPTWNCQFASTTTPGNYKQTNVFWFQIKHNIDLSESNTVN